MELSGGVEPYRFAWHTTYDLGLSKVYTASSFLNDTTEQFPAFLDHPLANEWNPFYLTVYDANGDSVTDTINVWFTAYAFALGYQVFYIEPGDSLLLSYSTNGNGGGGIEPVTAYWVPDESIYEATDGFAWFKPDTTIEYNIYRIDHNGCKSAENTVYQIFVSPKAQVPDIHDDKALYLQQIGNDIVFPNPKGDNAQVKIYTLNGQLLQETETHKNMVDISVFSVEKRLIVMIAVGNKSGSCLFLSR
jgi:hypothetical protein